MGVAHSILQYVWFCWSFKASRSETGHHSVCWLSAPELRLNSLRFCSGLLLSEEIHFYSKVISFSRGLLWYPSSAPLISMANGINFVVVSSATAIVDLPYGLMVSNTHFMVSHWGWWGTIWWVEKPSETGVEIHWWIPGIQELLLSSDLRLEISMWKWTFSEFVNQFTTFQMFKAKGKWWYGIYLLSYSYYAVAQKKSFKKNHVPKT